MGKIPPHNWKAVLRLARKFAYDVALGVTIAVLLAYFMKE